jgi:GAF domain-containing protein
MATSTADRVEDRFLYEIISTVASSLNLEEVLNAVVRLLSDASAVHACFVYLLEHDERRLVLRAASEPYSHLVDAVELADGEGIAWWALEHREPVFIRDNAVADPRFKYVPELEEERFQSFVSVPLLGRAEPIGAISLHSEAPREFTQSEVDFLISSAQLVAGAIENARTHDEMRLRVRELEQLMELGEAVAAAETLDELGPEVAARSRELLRADSVHLYLVDRGGERLRLHRSSPAGIATAAEMGLSELGPGLARRGRTPRVAVPLVAGDELVGALVADGTRLLDLARHVANHAAVAIKKIEVIERLAEKNLIRDFFDEATRGDIGAETVARAERLRFDTTAEHVVVVAEPGADELERALARAAPRSLFDRNERGLRAIVRVPSGGLRPVVQAIRATHADGADAAVGISNACRGLAALAAGFEEARHALLGTHVLRGRPRLLAYDDLGAYKYLLRMSLEPGGRDTHRQAIAALAEYDEAHSAQLVRTLEEFLARRGTISATAEALYIHPNTLRQRLRRIMELTGLDLRREDWLMVEIALKLASLERAMQAKADIPPARRV